MIELWIWTVAVCPAPMPMMYRSRPEAALLFVIVLLSMVSIRFCHKCRRRSCERQRGPSHLQRSCPIALSCGW